MEAVTGTLGFVLRWVLLMGFILMFATAGSLVSQLSALAGGTVLITPPEIWKKYGPYFRHFVVSTSFVFYFLLY